MALGSIIFATQPSILSKGTCVTHDNRTKLLDFWREYVRKGLGWAGKLWETPRVGEPQLAPFIQFGEIIVLICIVLARVFAWWDRGTPNSQVSSAPSFFMVTASTICWFGGQIITPP